ncbi:hypothetical protein D9M68_879620 [compost metagenome]
MHTHARPPGIAAVLDVQRGRAVGHAGLAAARHEAPLARVATEAVGHHRAGRGATQVDAAVVVRALVHDAHGGGLEALRGEHGDFGALAADLAVLPWPLAVAGRHVGVDGGVGLDVR